MLAQPDLCPLIRKAYELYGTNIYSLQGLSDKLFALGLTNRTGGKLCKRQVVDILTDPFYYSTFVMSFSNAFHSPTVSKDLWDKVHGLRVAQVEQGAKWSHSHPFCGLIRCAECGGAITSETHQAPVERQCPTLGCTTVAQRRAARRNVPNRSCARKLLHNSVANACQVFTGRVGYADVDTLISGSLKKRRDLVLTQRSCILRPKNRCKAAASLLIYMLMVS